jgi:hypothetical protein
MADVIQVEQRKAAYLQRLGSLAEEHRSQGSTAAASIPVNLIEVALRNLYDFAYLADTPLAEMEIVRKRMTGDKKTSLERGKAVHSILLDALEQMRPAPGVPREPPPREWYPYVILHDAYLDGIQNRNIMSKLYISEGTFNRTRRAAIRSLARTLTEMEHPG